MPETAMQMRCVHCLREQYAPAVLEISLGARGCVWCGRKSTPMTEAEFRAALTFGRAKKARTESNNQPS